MHIAAIGATGKVGTYMIPKLVSAGHDVTVVTRGTSKPRQDDPAWDSVKQVTIDRKAAEADNTFGKQIADLKPDVVIDMILFHRKSAGQIVDALKGKIGHFLFCGTHWVYGHLTEVPNDETAPRQPLCDYGKRKAAIEAYLAEQNRANGFPASTLHAGHIVCPSDVPINPCGNKDPEVFGRLARGEEVTIPNWGKETLHHVHADDLAQGFVKAIEHRDAAVGESFHILGPKAVTFRGYAEEVCRWFGKEPNLKFVPYEQLKDSLEELYAQQTWDHLAHSPNGSIEKARKLLEYEPKYTGLEACREAVLWLVDNGKIRV